jgi:DNA-binding MarR family transcriptional regulator
MHINLLANKLGALGVLIDEVGHDTTNALSKSSVAAVLTLNYRGPLSITELSRTIGLTQPATTRLVGGLVQGGIVQKRSGLSAREVGVRLTPRGSALAHELQTNRLARIASLLERLSAAEQKQLDGLLTAILGSAVQSRAQARQLCRFCDHEICDGPLCPVGCAATDIEERGGP